MIVSRLRVQFLLPGCKSLKEKRYVLNSLKSRLRNRFNVSVCEVDYQDKWQRCELGFASVATSRRGAERVVQQILTFLEKEQRISLIDTEKEFQ